MKPLRLLRFLFAIASLAAAVLLFRVWIHGGGRMALVGEQRRHVDMEMWGKVTDGHGNPVEGASIKFARDVLRPVRGSAFGAVESVLSECTTDAEGRFYIAGAGITIAVATVSKEGYVWIQSNDLGTLPGEPIYNLIVFRFMGADGPFGYVADPSSPATFVLLKEGETESHVKMSRGGKDVDRFGTIVNVPFWPVRTKPKGIRYVGPP